MCRPAMLGRNHAAASDARSDQPESAGVVCPVQHGAEWLQAVVDVLRPAAVRILDFPHAVEHLTAWPGKPQ